MPAEGFNVLVLDYRGYGKSAGSPSLAGAQLDVDAALRTLLERREVDPKRIVLFGQSLGGALALHYAARGPRRDALRAVIADSAFSDYRAIVREKLAGFFLTWPFQWLPAFTVDNDYSPLTLRSQSVSPLPLLLIHGQRDTIVPPEHSERLYRGRGAAEGALAPAGSGPHPVGARPRVASAARRLHPAGGGAGRQLREVARPAGFEPTTLGFGGQYSDPLSYGRLEMAGAR